MRDRFTIRAEIGLIGRAWREGWPTPPAQRAREVERLDQIAGDPAAPPRAARAAQRLLARMLLVAEGAPPPRRRDWRRRGRRR